MALNSINEFFKALQKLPIELQQKELLAIEKKTKTLRAKLLKKNEAKAKGIFDEKKVLAALKFVKKNPLAKPNKNIKKATAAELEQFKHKARKLSH
jgi:hypothetical protein